MEPSFFRYIFRYSLRSQLFLLFLTLASFPFLYISLELPKIIINEAIGGTDFPREIFGMPLEQIDYLFYLCGAFLLVVLIRFGFRYYINVYKGQVGERMLRRLRYQLFSRVLRFPLPRFRRTSQGEIIAMITAEVEPLGGFIGEAVATPAFEGGTMLTILVFMFVQDWKLGLAAMALSPIQAYIIPRLQAQVNVLAKERVRTVRKLSERLGEVVGGIEHVHAHDTSEYERAEIARWLGRIYEIRFKIYRKKFLIKFINNFFGQMTPFFFYALGGYLVITGELTFGALVAVLAAYKDLSSPWKELLKWYEIKEDTRVKYEQLVEQFEGPGLLSEAMQALPEGEPHRLSGSLVASNVVLEDEDGVKVVDSVSFSFALDERVALVGQEGSGASAVAKLIARLLTPTSGSLRIGHAELHLLPEAVTGRQIGYIGQGGMLFQGTIRANLFYGLLHHPRDRDPESGDLVRRRRISEARQSGNTTRDPDADWIDYAAAGVADDAGLVARTAEVLAIVEMQDDVFHFGLLGRVDPDSQPDLAQRILEARAHLRRRLDDKAYQGLVEPFDRNSYNNNMSVAENLLFGTPIGPTFDLDHIAENPYMLSVLRRFDLENYLLGVGLQVARIMVELFQDVQPGDELFERFSFITLEALPTYQGVTRRADPERLDKLSGSDRTLLLSLPFKLIPARHRLGLLTDDVLARLLDARKAFAEGLPEDLQDSVAFFDPDRYNAAASVQDNILFGRLVYGRPQAQRAVGALIGEVVDALDLRPAVIGIGLEHQVGIGGSRLSAAQRQKVAIARAILKQPVLLVLDQATAALDPGSQAAIMAKIVAERAGLVWVLNDAAEAAGFDRVLVMEHGRIVSSREPDAASSPESGEGPPEGPVARSANT